MKNHQMNWAVLAVVMARIAAAGIVQAVTIDLVTVGNPGNPGELSGYGADWSGPERICGAVDYTFQIGKYEITAGQYCEFLNAVAKKTDNYGLYWYGNHFSSYYIQRSGSEGNYFYSVAPDWANRPVTLISRTDAARFCNWLTNGQPTVNGDFTHDYKITEEGSYDLHGANDHANSLTGTYIVKITRTANARYVIPTEDEWYKAAYHKNDGVTGNYWDYSTGSDSAPNNDLISPDPGNSANFYIYTSMGGDFTLGSPYYRTEVGAFANSPSPYGTFDQGGNVSEWTDGELSNLLPVVRGGNWRFGASTLASSYRASPGSGPEWPPVEYGDIGFRIAYVPEPAGFLWLLTGSATVLFWKRYWKQ